MAFRILRYQIEMLSKHLKQHPESRTLPIIFPMIFYPGQKHYQPYPFSLHFLDLFVDRQLAQQALAAEILLIDLNRLEDKEIRKHQLLSLLETVCKHVPNHKVEDLLTTYQTIFKRLTKLPDNLLRNVYLNAI